MALLALALTLGIISAIKQRAGTASVLIHPAEQKLELMNDTIGPSSEVEPEARTDLERWGRVSGGAELPPPPPQPPPPA
jgi:hypothetical protein